MKPFSLDAYKLMHDGALALAEVEMNGIRVDVPYLEAQIEKTSEEITSAEKVLWKSKESRIWKSAYGSKLNFNSNTQLANVLFKRMKYKTLKATRKGNAAVDDEVLQQIQTPFTTALLQKRKLQKVRDTYLKGLLKEQIDGFLHPSFNLHLIPTYRSSSDGPNFQAIPVRDLIYGPMIRRAIIPHHPEDIIGEVDIIGAEVRVSCCYNKDPRLISYIQDPTTDMHRDTICKIYMLSPAQVDKKIRYYGKNGFVFPEFYGSYYALLAPNLWKASAELILEKEKITVRQWLISKGIRNLEQFTTHLEKVEDWFWNKQFLDYTQWKLDWRKQYLKTGYFDTLTGFRCQGPMSRNECLNYPVQGSAFHCLLWSLIQLQRWLVANEMKTQIIGQIHDSIVFNFAADEVSTVLKKAKKIMCEDIRKHWDWIIVPMDIEAELSPVGGTWAEKKKVVIE